MSKLSLISRNEKRAKMIKKFSTKRTELKLKIRATDDFAAKMKYSLELDSLPRNSSKKRWVSRCIVTGKAKGVSRKFGLCRNKLREFFILGIIPGFKNSSW